MKLSKKLLSILLCTVMVLGSVAVGGEGFAEMLGDMLDSFSVKASAADTYTVSWYVDGECILSEQVQVGDDILAPEDPWKAGFDFAGWTPEIPNTMPATNLQFDAQFTIPQYVISWIVDGETICETGVRFGDEISFPEDPVKAGFTFIGWFDSYGDEVKPGSYFSFSYSELYAAFEKDKLLPYIISNGEAIINYYDTDIEGEIIIPSKIEGYPVTTISDKAFENCLGLTSVTIPSSVTSIGKEVFSGCTGLTNITVESGNPNYLSDEYGVLFNKNKTELVQYPAGSTGINYIIPDSVTTVDKNAFCGCSALTSVTIGSGVTKIGDYAFKDCTHLTEINWNAINCADFIKDSEIFNNAGIDGTGINVTFGDSVKKIPAYLFCCYFTHQYSPNVTSVTISGSVKSIGYCAFYNCDNIQRVNYTGTVSQLTAVDFNMLGANPTMYAKDLYINDELLTEAVIENGVETISPYAFEYCTSLTSVTIPDSVTSIGNSAFSGCTGLTSITIGSSVTSIGNSAFYGCTALESIHIPGSVTSISSSVLSGCTSLEFICSDSNSCYAKTFANSNGYTFRLCDGHPKGEPTEDDFLYVVTWNVNGKSEKSTFRFGDTIVHPADPEKDGYVFTGWSPAVPATMPAEDLEFFAVFEKLTAFGFTYMISDSEITITGFDGEEPKVAVIPSEINGYPVTSIGSSAFYKCTGLTSVTIPNSVTSIGNSAFEGCTSLESIHIPGSVTSISSSVLSGCTSLEFICSDSNSSYAKTFANSNGYTFRLCGGHPKGEPTEDDFLYVVTWNVNGKSEKSTFRFGDTIVHPADPEKDGYVFTGWSPAVPATMPAEDLTFYAVFEEIIPFELTYTIKDGKVTIRGFNGEISGTVVIPSTIEGYPVKRIDDYAFYGCTGLTSVTIPDSVTSIGSEAFYKCTGLTSVTMGNSVTSIGEYAFNGCTGLTSVTIPDSVNSIGSWAFYNVPNVCYSENMKATGSPWGAKCVNGYVDGYLVYSDSSKVALCGCSSAAVGSIIIPDSITSIGRYAFYRCTGLTSVTMGNSVTSIEDYAFNGCAGLTSVIIPDSVTSIGINAFGGCTGLTSITFPDSVTSIGDFAFEFCHALESVTIPENVTYIGEAAFLGCFSLSTVNYNAVNVDSIEDEYYTRFFCCPITEINIGENVESFPNNIFVGMISAEGKNLKFSCPDDLLKKSPNLFACVSTNTAACDEYTFGVWYREICETYTSEIGITFEHLNDVLYYPVFEVNNPNSYLYEYVTKKHLHYVLAYQLHINNGEEELVMNAGETVRLNASAVGAPDYPITCTWKSYSKGIAQVDGSGNVTGISCGTATITATAADGSTASIDIVINHSMAKQLTITPTCVQEGGDLYTCSTCGISRLENKAPALGHTYTDTVIAPTCEANGYDYHHCNRCGYNYTDNITPALGHDDENVIIRQTCIQDGYVLKICKTCGRTVKADEATATGHSFTSWATITAATESSEGLAQRHCTKCGYTEDKILSVINRTTFYVTFVANGKTVATVEYVKGSKTINEPAVPHKDRFTGEWEPYTLNDTDITVNARYTVIDLDTVSGIETSKNAAYNSATGEATINIHAASEGKTVISTSTQAVPLDIVLVVDQSGSMAERLGGKNSKKQALINASNNFVSAVYADAVENNVDHRVAVVGFGMGCVSSGYEYPAYLNTEILTTGGSPIQMNDLTAGDYARALMSVNNGGALNANITSAIANIDAKGATAADYGLSMANSIFANTDGTGRQRIVVFMTDGAPTTTNDFETRVASAAILQANELKNTYGATVYSVGVMSSAEATQRINTFMNYVSSNYSDAESMSGRYKKSADGYYINVENTNTLSTVFTDIVTENITRTTDFDNITVIDTVSKYFTLTSQQEKALRVNAIETYGVKNSDIEITRNADETTTVIIRNISPVDTGSCFEVNLSFNVSANENAVKAGTYATNTDDAGIIIGDTENYECVLDVPTVTIPQDRKVSIFKINGEVFEISSSATVTAPATDFAGEYEFTGWDLENGTAVSDNVTVYDASYICKQDYIVVWNTAEGTQKVRYNPGDVITEPDAGFDGNGNAFRRWNGTIPVVMPAESIEFTAVYGDHEHQYISETVKEVMCLENGTVRYTCSICGDSYEDTIMCPGHHTWKAIAGTVSGESGYEEFECEVCGEHSNHCLEYIITASEQKEDGTYNSITNEFTYYDENGNSVQPDGYVNITVPVEEYFGDAKNVEVYRVNPDGTRTKCDSTFEYGILKFLTNHFSTYVFVISDSPAQPIQDIVDSPASFTMAQRTLKVGDSAKIIVSSNYTVESRTWTADSPNVASVDSHGNVTAINEGICYITVVSYGTDESGNQVSSKTRTRIVVVENNADTQTTKEKFESKLMTIIRDFIENLKVIFRFLAPFIRTE